jgi:hypothetical protein
VPAVGQPQGIAVDPALNAASLASCRFDSDGPLEDVAVIDTGTFSVAATLASACNRVSIALDPVTHGMYIASSGFMPADGGRGPVTVVDGSSGGGRGADGGTETHRHGGGRVDGNALRCCQCRQRGVGDRRTRSRSIPA